MDNHSFSWRHMADFESLCPLPERPEQWKHFGIGAIRGIMKIYNKKSHTFYNAVYLTPISL